MNLTISSLLAGYRENQFSPEQVVDFVLQRSTQFIDKNIWISLLSREQIQPYIENLKTAPKDLPLYGIPFAIKDNIDLAGVCTTAACSDFEYLPSQSAFVVAKLIEAGAIPIGKTNMDQFATGLVGTRSPEPWGICQNAFDSSYIAGGSSSGSAVAVSLGLVSFSLGTDTAGSGRVPAALNNLIGLKPSKGLLSMQGVVPACRSLDCVSIFALNTDDANSVFNVAAVYDDKDDYARKNTFENNHRFYREIKHNFSFLVPKTAQLDFFGDKNTAELFDASVDQLINLGGKKVEVDFSPFLSAAKLLYEGPWVAERYVAIEETITKKTGALLPVIKQIIGGAVKHRATDVFKSQYQLQHLKKITDAILNQADFLLTPTVGTTYTIDEVERNPIELNTRLGYYTNYMNLLDYVCIAVPGGFLDKGLPWGVSLVAPAFSDRRLLSYARLLQSHLQLPLGAGSDSFIPEPLGYPIQQGSVSIVVCGAHLSNLPLNWQLTERHATLLEKTTTSDSYRMYALAGGPPYRPGLIRDECEGVSIEIEVWSLPSAEFGSFVANIPAPLGIGKVEIQDGRWLPGFICEPYGITDAEEITHLGSWRSYMEHLS